MNEELIPFYNENKSYCYFTQFKKIFTFIGCEQEYDENKIGEILHNNLNNYSSITTRFFTFFLVTTPFDTTFFLLLISIPLINLSLSSLYSK